MSLFRTGLAHYVDVPYFASSSVLTALSIPTTSSIFVSIETLAAGSGLRERGRTCFIVIFLCSRCESVTHRCSSLPERIRFTLLTRIIHADCVECPRFRRPVVSGDGTPPGRNNWIVTPGPTHRRHWGEEGASISVAHLPPPVCQDLGPGPGRFASSSLLNTVSPLAPNRLNCSLSTLFQAGEYSSSVTLPSWFESSCPGEGGDSPGPLRSPNEMPKTDLPEVSP